MNNILLNGFIYGFAHSERLLTVQYYYIIIYSLTRATFWAKTSKCKRVHFQRTTTSQHYERSLNLLYASAYPYILNFRNTLPNIKLSPFILNIFDTLRNTWENRKYFAKTLIPKKRVILLLLPNLKRGQIDIYNRHSIKNYKVAYGELPLIYRRSIFGNQQIYMPAYLTGIRPRNNSHLLLMYSA